MVQGIIEVRNQEPKKWLSGDAARAGKYDAKVVEHIFQTLEQMIESNIKARKKMVQDIVWHAYT